MRNYWHFSSVSLERRVPLGEHGVETVQFELQRAPDLHPEEGAGVVHDVHGGAVQQGPDNMWANVRWNDNTIYSNLHLICNREN